MKMMRLTEFYKVSGFDALTVAFAWMHCDCLSTEGNSYVYVTCAMLSSNVAPLYNELSELSTCIHIEIIITSLLIFVHGF